MKVTEDGITLYNGGQVIGLTNYTVRTMENMPLPRVKRHMASMVGAIRKHYDLENVSGEYGLNAGRSPMETFLRSHKSAEKRYDPLVRSGEILMGLKPKEALGHLFAGRLYQVNFLWENLRRKVQEGYARENVKLSLSDNKNVLLATIALEFAEMRKSGKKSRLEDIVLNYAASDKIKVEPDEKVKQ